MKKILLLGGSAQQIVAIETAKKLGYYTVVCDYLVDNPGQYHADKFCLVSTTDREAVFAVAEKEHIAGILAYASDPAAPTAAYVAEKLGLPTNPFQSVEILCNKDKFRTFLSENDFATPRSKGYASLEEVIEDIEEYHFPIIIKPVDSSGSKGVTVLWTKEKLEEAVKFAFSFSRSQRIIVEEFVEKKHPYLIGGDIFVLDGKIVLWGLLNCHRDQSVNSLVPVGKSFPLNLDELDVQKVQETLQQLVDKLHIENGAMNIEMVVDKTEHVYLIDVGPRNGGNMIPDLLGMIFDVDVVELAIKVAMGEKCYIEKVEGIPCYATYNVHVNRNGRFKEVIYSDEIKAHVIKQCIYKKEGDFVEFFDNAAKAIGIVFMKFDNALQMEEYFANMNMHIRIVLEDE